MENGIEESANTATIASTLLNKCGPFQILLVILGFLPKLGSTACLYFMAFGAYNPGWRCLDNYNITDFTHGLDLHGEDNATSGMGYQEHVAGNYTKKTSEFVFESCQEFYACDNVEFNPSASTIVSQFELVCDKAWVANFITSLNMAGLPVGTVIVGYFGDRFGRKWTLYSSLFCLGTLFVISVFSTSWQMFAALQFFLGIFSAIVMYAPIVLIHEFLPGKWRTPVSSIPVWNLGMLVFCVFAITLQEWNQIVIASAVVSFAALLPCFWVPESLRWLNIKGKHEDSEKVAQKIIKLNKLEATAEDLKSMFQTSSEEEGDFEKKGREYHMLDLFRKRWKYASVISVYFFCLDCVYMATNFGVALFPGNVYVNMIIMSASELPANVISSFLPNIIGRKKSGVGCLLISCSCYVTAVLFDRYADEHYRMLGLLILVSLAKIFMNISYYSVTVLVFELFPTVLRSTALSYAGLMAGIGSMISPYMIPTSREALYKGYAIFAGLFLLCCILVSFLPETKGRPLPDTWDEDDDDDGEGNDHKSRSTCYPFRMRRNISINVTDSDTRNV